MNASRRKLRKLWKPLVGVADSACSQGSAGEGLPKEGMCKCHSLGAVRGKRGLERTAWSRVDRRAQQSDVQHGQHRAGNVGEGSGQITRGTGALWSWQSLSFIRWEQGREPCVFVLQSCLTLCGPTKTVAHQIPLSTELSRQEYWGGLPCPPPGNLPDPGI